MPSLRLCAFAVILLPTLAQAAEPPAELAGIRERIVEQVDEGNVPSLAVAVARDGVVLWEEGFGLADRASERKADEQTMYSLASISKPITATGLMILAERGKLDLDRPIDDYLGEAKLTARVGDASAATVRQVANHSSGLPLHYQFFYVDEPGGPPSREETIARYGLLYTPPGEGYQYSNVGYGILDHVIERVSEQPYAEFMRDEVFAPLGLLHMAVDIPAGLEDQTATRYTDDGTPLPFYTFDHPGASAVFASAHDLVRFGMFHTKTPVEGQEAILSDETLSEMQRPTAATEGNRGRTGYGIGWATARNGNGYTIVSHTGGMPGVNTILLFVPAERIVVVALANARSNLPSRIAHAIVDELLPEKADAEKQPPTARELASTDIAHEGSGNGGSEVEAKTTPDWAELAGTWQGAIATYQGDRPLVLAIDREGKVEAGLNDASPETLNDVGLKNGVLRGVVPGELGTEDSRRVPGDVHLELRLVDDKLQGKAIVISHGRPRGGNALTHWVELRRE